MGVDIDSQPSSLGESHLRKPHLQDLVHDTINEGTLKVSKKVVKSDVFIIAVPTPFLSESHEPDLSFIKEACGKIAPVLEKNNLIILESTSPVGTLTMLTEFFSTIRPDLHFPKKSSQLTEINIAYCPERVLPGNIIHEIVV